ncbi:PP2C family protein-serine/threonine phosphatase [Streptomyces sp. NPDC004065]|uniref:PP2C family protein-serine/threonine phosphatase n=1 Tax=Streptomyces sp. NPDC004065 TaxID=3364689 RepID=UPI0038507FF8
MPDVVGWLSRDGARSRPVYWVTVLALIPVVLLAVDLATPPSIRLGPMMVAAPTFAAAFCGPAGVLVVVGVTLPCVLVAAAINEQLNAVNFPVQISTIALISAAAVAASAVRVRRERQLARSRWVAEVTQRVLLHPLPRRIGPFGLASLYVAADEEAAIGGDLYAVARHGRCSRILLGDVQGKGLAALEIVSCVLNGFRQTVRHGTPLTEVVRELEAVLQEEIGELAAADDADCARTGTCGEAFVTAVVLELPDEGPLRLANLGHPPPLLLHEGSVTALEPAVPAPPLGLADLGADDVVVEEADFPPGATLVLYTDGVTEARRPDGTFYPLAERLRQWTALPPDALLTAVRADLRRHVNGSLTDDVAMVAVQRSPAPVPASSGPRSAELTRVHRTA